jgi:hypothetical protein
VQFIVNLLEAILNLFAGKVRALKRGVGRVLVAIALLAVCLEIALAMIALVCWGLYSLLSPTVGSPGAAFIIAALLFVPAAAMVMGAKAYME